MLAPLLAINAELAVLAATPEVERPGIATAVLHRYVALRADCG